MTNNESKRRRGAQPGSKNAMKHVYYSRASKCKLSYFEKVIFEFYSVISEANSKNCKMYNEVCDV